MNWVLAEDLWNTVPQKQMITVNALVLDWYNPEN